MYCSVGVGGWVGGWCKSKRQGGTEGLGGGDGIKRDQMGTGLLKWVADTKYKWLPPPPKRHHHHHHPVDVGLDSPLVSTSTPHTIAIASHRPALWATTPDALTDQDLALPHAVTRSGTVTLTASDPIARTGNIPTTTATGADTVKGTATATAGRIRDVAITIPAGAMGGTRRRRRGGRGSAPRGIGGTRRSRGGRSDGKEGTGRMGERTGGSAW